MYVKVRFGAGEEAIFNPNCRSVSLLRSIRDRCLSPQEVDTELQHADIDLSDERGNIKFLRDTPLRYANEILSDRESLILLRVDKHDGAYAFYKPLLKDDKAITEDFLARLCVRKDVTDDQPDNSRCAKSNTRRSTALVDKDKDGRRGNGDHGSRSLKPEKNNSRSRSHQEK